VLDGRHDEVVEEEVLGEDDSVEAKVAWWR
jgi:hypothetical protein